MVVFSNAEELSDSLVCVPLALRQIPIDMYSDSMSFILKDISRNSSFYLRYTTEVSKEAIALKLGLENITAGISQGTNTYNLYQAETLNQTSVYRRQDILLDERSDWNFINDVSGVVWVE
jgi:hypothetical protein